MLKPALNLSASNIIDEDVRLKALNPTRSFIVQAPAGSGKTRLLITRYLTLLATVAEPEEIVAITFTRKAAAEMRQRIQAALGEASSRDATESSEASESTLHQAARAALTHDAARGWNLLQSPNRFRIQTIDAFNAALARQAPLTTRFGAQPQSTERPQALYEEAARQTLSALDDRNSYSTAVATLLLHLDNDYAKLTGLVAQMLAKRDQWLRNFPGLNVATQSVQLRDGLQRTLIDQRVAKFSAAAALFAHPELPSPAQILVQINYAQHNLKLPEMPEFGGTTANAGPIWATLADYFLTKDGGIRKTINKNNGFPPDGKDAKAQKDAFIAILSTLQAIPNAAATIEALRNLPAAQYTDAEWQVLEAAWQLLPYAISCLWQVFARHGECDFTEIALAADRALGTEDTPTDLALKLDVAIAHILVDEFQDTSQAQFNLLQRLTAQWGAEVGRTLFLVGDPMQSIYRFREAKVGLFLHAQQHGLGSVALNSCSLALNFRSHPTIVDWINTTFSKLMVRASSGIDYLPSSSPFKTDDADENSAEHGVTLHAIAQTPTIDIAWTKVAEAERITAAIVDARKVDPAGTIAILVRSRTHLAQILPALRRANIDYIAHELDQLDKRIVVQDCITLTRALLHDSDRIAWLGCLRAPWCGLSLAELDALFGLAADAQNQAPLSVFQRLQTIEQLFTQLTISAESQAALLHFKQAVNAARANLRRQTLRDCVEQCWLSLNGPACIYAKHKGDDTANASRDARDLADVATFFDCLENCEVAGNLIDFDTLAIALRARFSAAPTASRSATAETMATMPAVEIMTIHKAKGLEFDTVIIPGLNQRPNRDQPQLLLWQELEYTDSQSSFTPMLLAPIAEAAVETSTDAPQTIYRYLSQLSQVQQRQEDIRLLYVAATRTVKRLHLLACLKIDLEKLDAPIKPVTNSLLAALWPALGDGFSSFAFKAAHAIAPAVDANLPATLSLASAATALQLALEPLRLVRDLSPPVALPLSAPPEREQNLHRPNNVWQRASAQNIMARHTGTVIHEWLAKIASEGVANWNTEKIANAASTMAQRFARLGIFDAAQLAATRDVRAQLQLSLSSPRGRWLLASHPDAKSEWPLAGSIDGAVIHAIIDRSFIDEKGVRWIVDYKTATPAADEDLQQFLSAQQEQYAPQLALYATLVWGLGTTFSNNAENMPQSSNIMLGLYYSAIDAWQEWEFIAS